MNGTVYFERLLASAERIAGHANFPGKGEAVDQCLEDIDDLLLADRITEGQRDMLRAVLLGSLSHAA